MILEARPDPVRPCRNTSEVTSQDTSTHTNFLRASLVLTDAVKVDPLALQRVKTPPSRAAMRMGAFTGRPALPLEGTVLLRLAVWYVRLRGRVRDLLDMAYRIVEREKRGSC